MLPLYISDVPLHCINEAAIEYNVPAKLIISILNVERGKMGSMVKNKNGTFDLGPLQVNSRWLPTLKKYGYSAQDLIYDACKNVSAGSWLLAKAIANNHSPFFWQAVGDYHSHTHYFNVTYAQKVLGYSVTINNIAK